MGQVNRQLIKQEQDILDTLIQKMDQALLESDSRLTAGQLSSIKANARHLSDAYTDLLAANHSIAEATDSVRMLRSARNELYQTRIEVSYEEDGILRKENLKIGLRSYCWNGEIFITDWRLPICRHYLLDNTSEVFENVTKGRYEDIYTVYHLNLKRSVDIIFDKVKDVVQQFPLYDESGEQIIVDEFLRELLKRRSEEEFKNIIFSIQKQQGDIIRMPLTQSIIVQGCAGSGKSMILFHRLPILLYDNAGDLPRTGIYIVTPSVTYMQMAQNMRTDLDIEDIKMSTLEQYFDYAIEKYGRKRTEYGRRGRQIFMSPEIIERVYSHNCREEMESYIRDRVNDCNFDYQSYAILMDPLFKMAGPQNIPADKIQKDISNIQKIISANKMAVEQSRTDIFLILKRMNKLIKALEERKSLLLRTIVERITEELQIVSKKQIELQATDSLQQKKKYTGLQTELDEAKAKIEDLQFLREYIEIDDDSFEESRKIALLLKLYMERLDQILTRDIPDSFSVYMDSLKSILDLLLKIEGTVNPYAEYESSLRNLLSEIKKLCRDRIQKHRLFLDSDAVAKLNGWLTALKKVHASMVVDTYTQQMERFGLAATTGTMTAAPCSAYLFLQALYLYYGSVTREREKMICIDEAQNITPEELLLISNINGKNVIFNLFGDEKQHVEGSKGINSWQEFSAVSDFQMCKMEENYRNARQITEYCNNRFHMQMKAINLDGAGVHEIENEEDCIRTLETLFQKSKKNKLSCIVIQSKEEAETILALFDQFSNNILDHTRAVSEVSYVKWNLMTVDQVKGLEFGMVFVLSGRMSQNEKYIAYTRALDELFVFDGKIHAVDKKDSSDRKTDTPISTERPKRKKRSLSDLSSNDVEII